MPELYFANDASRSQEHRPPILATQSPAVVASQESFAAKGCSATIVNDAGQVIGSKSSTKRSSRACTMLDQRRVCGIHHACSVLASGYNTRC